MQENINYVIVEKSQSIGSGGAGLQVLNDGVFVGTKKYMFFIPSKMQDMDTRKVTTSTYYYAGMDMASFIAQKVKEEGLTVVDFENFMITHLSKELEGLQILSLDNDIEQFKVMTGFFGGDVIINETTRKVGWKPFVNKLGKKKKEVWQFYKQHEKLKNK